MGVLPRVPNFHASLKRSGQAALYCAHRTSTVLSCAFCEQEGHLAASLSGLSDFPLLLGGGLVDPQLRASNEHLLSVRVPRAGGRPGRPLFPLLMGNSPQPPATARLCSTMEQTRAYHRSLYRLPVTYPAMYCVMSTVGQGTITNLSAVGCTIETDRPLLAEQDVALRLMLPDQRESLPIDEAQVRWVHGNLAGIEFVQVEPTANLRLHGFVWDQMVQRVHTIQQHRATS